MMYDVERKRVVASVLAHQDDINSVCYVDMAYQPHLILSGSDDSFLKVRLVLIRELARLCFCMDVM